MLRTTPQGTRSSDQGRGTAPGATARGGRRLHAGQSVVEFAVLLPVLLALVGVTIDVARLYQSWTNLESATRDAAQYIATSNVNAADPDYGGTNTAAKAKTIVDAATGATFATSGSLDTCTSPTLSATYSQSTTAAGASDRYPIGTSVVRVCQPFRTLFGYPLLTVNGNWVLRSERTYAVLVGR